MFLSLTRTTPASNGALLSEAKPLTDRISRSGLDNSLSLLFSILAHPGNLQVQEQFYISEAIALAVSDSVMASIGPEFAADVSVKWSNDVYWKDFKMAGILIENTLQGSRILDTVAGVGLDVNQEVFVSDASPVPVNVIV